MSNSPRAIMRVQGQAVTAVVRKGTASEHTGVVLKTQDGGSLVLVRLGGNPFDDPQTQQLAGRHVEVEGYRVGNELRYTSAREIA